MTKELYYPKHCDYLEYQGSTIIKRTRKAASGTVCCDWLIFNSVEEASTYFNESWSTQGVSHG